MAKKLTDIAKMVDAKADGFYDYLKQVLNRETFSALIALSQKTNVYVFSGVIRNYFLEIYETRDFDIVLYKPVNIESVFKNYKIRKNSFGGYKIKVGNQNIDLWFLEDTWALKKEGPKIGINLEQYIPYTAFFNFSAVTYSFNEGRFYYHSAFLSFLRDKKINYVYEPNANPALCIINTIYYSDKYALGVDSKMMRYVVKMHRSKARNYEMAQIRHFGKVLYTASVIDKRITEFVLALMTRSLARKKGKLNKHKYLPANYPLWLSIENN